MLRRACSPPTWPECLGMVRFAALLPCTRLTLPGYVFDRFATAGPELENLGFPIPPSSEVPPCDYGAGARACSRAGTYHCRDASERG